MEAALERDPVPIYTPRALATGEILEPPELLEAPLKTMPRPSILDAPITTLRGAGPKLSAAASEMGISSLGDLLRHIPHSYRDRADPVGLGDLRLGEEATVEVEVAGAKLRPTRRRRLTILEADVFDQSGKVKAVWFNRAWLADRLQPGCRLLIRGKLEKRGFNVAEHEFLDSEGGGPAGLHTTGIVPVHPASEKLRPQRIREWVWQATPMARHAGEPIPGRLRRELRIAGATDSIVASHFPADEHQAEAARERLAFEELFLYQAALVSRRGRRASGAQGIVLPAGGADVAAWLESLPFSLTDDQTQALDAIDDDLTRENPMQRLLMGEVGSGKAQPMDALVLTPAGFRRMAEIRIGDEVVNPTGETTRVTGVFPQGEREVCRVHFSDGTSVECDREHLWQVQTSTARCRGDKPKVLSLNEIADDLRRPSGAAKWHVELPEPSDLESGRPRPVEPYALGLLLGDGGLSIPSRVRFSSADPELVDALRAAVSPECELRKETHRPYDWKVVGTDLDLTEVLTAVEEKQPETLAVAYRSGASCDAIAEHVSYSAGTVRRRLIELGVIRRPPNRPPSLLLRQLMALGLMGKSASEKCVPEEYLNAPIAVRHAVLQGLLDTDGTLDRTQGSNVTFSSVSQRLAEDLAWLVRSLGGRARCRQVHKLSGRSWLTSIILPARFPPFRLQRKAALLKPRTKYANPAKAIERIESVGPKPVQCISVAHPNQLYITDAFTVTHNTVVALHAMLRAIEAGHQAALMAPTETLAEQHFRTLESLRASEAATATLLTSATPPAERRELLHSLASGKPQLVVGTHALIEDAVEFSSLAIAVVDEQHRFGVRQRAALDAKGPGKRLPHVLHMTATPIPRTLSLTAYGDLDTTALRELPKGRQPIRTRVVDEEHRAAAYEFIRERLREGRQTFVVCPLVSESELTEAKAAEAEAKRLAKTEFRDFRVALLHGQMSSDEKTRAMDAFVSGEAHVLVATTVIEVGIDVPNATVMLVEGAERFGLSQLHQLRGRVGRGEHESFCILFGDPESEAAKARLEAIAGEGDGFALAEVDLTIRGEGEILGTRQHGLPRFRAASLPEDTALLLEARRRVLELRDRFGSLEAPGIGPLLDEARRRFGDERVEQIAA